MNVEKAEETLKELCKDLSPLSYDEGPWVAGGAVVRALTDEQPADVDVFFRDKGQLEAFQAELSKIGCVVKEERFVNVTLVSGVKVQLITSEFFDSLDEVLRSFDISVCMCGFADGGVKFFSINVKEQIQNREARIVNFKRPTSTWRRVFDYSKRGFQFKARELSELLDHAGNDDMWEKCNPAPSGKKYEDDGLIDEIGALAVRCDS